LLRRKHSSADPVCLKEDSTFHGFVFRDSFWSLNAFLIFTALCSQRHHRGRRVLPGPPGRLFHDDQDPIGPQRGRLAAEQIYTPETVFHVAQESQPGGTTGGPPRPVVMGENPSNHVLVDGMWKAKAICWAIRGQPQLGLRCFISTTALMSSALGPCGPGFRRRFGENSMRYFRLLMAW
jgi:hypothetical protein